MAYYLGRDIDIAITTESAYYGVAEVDASGVNTAACLDFRQVKGAAGTQYSNSTHASQLFAGPRNQGSFTTGSNNPWAGSITGNGASTPADDLDIKAEAWDNIPNNITGLDLAFGVMDEDVAFVGQRNVLKAEIKKDNSVTITRKKADNVWNTVYNDARFGLIDHDDTADNSTTNLVSGAASFHQGLTAPDYQECGYRIYLRFGGSTANDEIFILRNCYITDFTVTMGADSSQEESLTLQTYIDPVIRDGQANDALDTLTPTAEL